MRLIGHYQAQPGRELTAELALRRTYRPAALASSSQSNEPLMKFCLAAPLPMFEGVNMLPGKRFDDAPVPIRVPPLSPDRAAEYTKIFDKAGAENGLLAGMRDLLVPGF